MELVRRMVPLMTALPKGYSAVRERRTLTTDVNGEHDITSISGGQKIMVCSIDQGESFNCSNTELGHCSASKQRIGLGTGHKESMTTVCLGDLYGSHNKW